MDTEPSPLASDEEIERIEQAFMRRVGARVREIRSSKGFTPSEVATEHGIDLARILRVEDGLETLTARSAVQLAVALDVEPYELFLKPSDGPAKRPKRKKKLGPVLGRAALTQRVLAFKAQIGRRIYDLRTIQGMSLEMLTEFSGVDRKQMGLIESGAANMRARSVVKVAEAIGVLPHELYLPRDQSEIRAKKSRSSAASKKASKKAPRKKKKKKTGRA